MRRTGVPLPTAPPTTAPAAWRGTPSRAAAIVQPRIEPAGALAAAALLNRRIDARGRRVSVILSGGNVDFSQVDAWRRMA
jgi:hypothetical protein